MENLIFSLNATIPIFLMILTGMLLRKIGWVGSEFAAKMNNFVFRVALPVMVFHDLGSVDFVTAWDTRFVVFCFFATLLSIGISWLLSCALRDRSLQGEFIQASYRSSAAILGLAFIHNIYGSSGMAPLMILGSVPLYNIMAVCVLSFFSPENGGRIDSAVLKKSLRGIVTNPIILGIFAGLLWSLLIHEMPGWLNKYTSSLGSVASPMGLIAMGASFELEKGKDRFRPALLASFIKLIGFCCIFMIPAVKLGFRNEELIAILVMLGSATTVSSYVMARNMGHEGSLTAATVAITTFFCSFTLTFWLFVMRAQGWI